MPTNLFRLVSSESSGINSHFLRRFFRMQLCFCKGSKKFALVSWISDMAQTSEQGFWELLVQTNYRNICCSSVAWNLEIPQEIKWVFCSFGYSVVVCCFFLVLSSRACHVLLSGKHLFGKSLHIISSMGNWRFSNAKVRCQDEKWMKIADVPEGQDLPVAFNGKSDIWFSEL